MNRATMAILVFCTALGISAMAGPLEPITVLELKEPSGVYREAFPVTTGVPLPVGLISPMTSGG